MAKLYLIDGMSLVFRAYFALQRSGLHSPEGEPTFAVFSFVNILTSILEKENPEYIAVAFDRQEKTFRHIMYPEYKANRAAFPEDLVPQLKRIKELLDLLSIKQIEMPGFEADDIIGTLTKHASNEGMDTACLTNDKDYYQLVDENVRLFKPTQNQGEDFQIVNIDAVKEKFGVLPSQVIDVLALIGDSSDNVPGVPGIGEKSAIPLIQQFGSLENIYDNIDKIEKKSVKQKLIDNKDIAFLSKTLVTIDRAVPIDCDIYKFNRETPNYQGLDAFLKELGLNSVRKRWNDKAVKELKPEDTRYIQNEQAIDNANQIDNTTDINSEKHKYILVNTLENLDKMLIELNGINLLSVDLETSSLNRQTCEIVGIALSAKPNRAFYIAVEDADYEPEIKNDLFNTNEASLFDVPAKEDSDNKNKKRNEYIYLPIDKVIKKLKPILENINIGKCGQNIKFDAFILKRFGADVSPIVFDSMLASYLLNPDDQHNLDALSKKWLNYTPIPISALIGEKKSQQASMRDIDPVRIAEYAGEDADLALKLRNVLYDELQNQSSAEHNLLKLAEEIEFPLIEVLTRMETNGIAIDTKALDDMSVQMAEEAKTLTIKIYKEAGTDFNIDSPKQLAHVLFEKLMIPSVKKTKTGFSTDVEVLTQLAPFYPIASYMLDYRQLQKLKSTYIDTLPKLINNKTRRIHTTFNQTIASTGRLSSTDPNLQNIPIRTELGREIRKAFIPQFNDRLIMSADYSQVELRIMAFYSQDKHLIQAFKDGLDVHSATASILFDIPLDQVDSDKRRTAKTVNFGIMYGLGSFGLSQRLGIQRNEAQSIINNYFAKYPGIKKYMDETIKSTEKNGYAETLCGRRRYFPQITSSNKTIKSATERAAINMPIQGTASDMMKIAMIRIDNKMQARKFKSIMMLQVHDELVFEVFPDEIDELKLLIKTEMETALTIGDVPVIAEIGVGKNWFEAH